MQGGHVGAFDDWTFVPQHDEAFLLAGMIPVTEKPKPADVVTDVDIEIAAAQASIKAAAADKRKAAGKRSAASQRQVSHGTAASSGDRMPVPPPVPPDFKAVGDTPKSDDGSSDRGSSSSSLLIDR